MIRFKTRTAYHSLILLSFCVSLFADNPIITQRYTADPNAFIFNDRVYVVCSSDEDNVNSYNLINYTMISSDDMVNWTDHNLVFKVKEHTKWAGQAYAPCAITRDGKVYLYFPDPGSGIGVMVADRPEGPYTDHLGRSLINRSTPNCSEQQVGWLFDPGIFIDSTASGTQAYLVFGGGQPFGTNLRIVRVNDDMKSISGTPQTLTAPNSFEGPFLHKYNNKYYLSYPTSNGSNIDYMMSDNPMTGWTYKGTALPNPTLNGRNINGGNNSHESMIEYKGQWYMFYHDRRLSGGATYKRNASVELMYYETDGRIKTVIVTSEGAPQIKNFNPYDTIQAETIWKQQGIETAFCNEGGVMLTDVANNDYTSLKGVDFGEGAKTFYVRASAPSNGGTVEVHLDSPNGPLVASCTVSGTGSWQNWRTDSCNVNNCSGVKNVYFVYKGSGDMFRANWFRFAPLNPVGISYMPKQARLVSQKGTVISNPIAPVKIINGMSFDLSGRSVTSVINKSNMSNLPVNLMTVIKKQP